MWKEELYYNKMMVLFYSSMDRDKLPTAKEKITAGQGAAPAKKRRPPKSSSRPGSGSRQGSRGAAAQPAGERQPAGEQQRYFAHVLYTLLSILEVPFKVNKNT